MIEMKTEIFSRKKKTLREIKKNHEKLLEIKNDFYFTPFYYLPV